MKNLYNKLGALAVAASVFFGINQDAEAAKRRVVVEDHTGAWCGWCVLGTQQLEDNYIEFGTDFIPVAIHNGDAMAVSTIQTPLATFIGLGGYPNGSLNRRVIADQNKIAIHPTSPRSWTYYATEMLKETTFLDVDVEWNLDQSGNLTAKVSAIVEEDMNGEYAFNLFIMEDGLTGSGSQWDQANFLAGRAGYETHPYFSKPSTITGYVHDNVLRDMLGGIYGENAKFTTTDLKAGETYTHDFSANISGKIKDPSNVWVVAVVHQSGATGKEIVNAKMDGKPLPKPVAKVEITDDGGVYNKHDAGTSVVETLTLTNPNDYEITVDISVDGTKSVTPAGWTSKLSQNLLTIPAMGTATTELTLNTTNTAGLAMINVKAEVQSTDEYNGRADDLSVYSLSNSTENAFLVFSNNNTPIIQSFNTLQAYSSKAAYIPYSDEIANAYPFEDFELIMVNLDFTNRGALASNGVLAGGLSTALNNGKKVLLTHIIEALFATGNPISGLTVAPEARDLYRNTLGIETYNPAAPVTIAQQNGNQVSLTPLNVSGESGDVDFSGVAFTINQYSQSTHPYYTYWVDRYKITNTNTTQPILRYNNSGIPTAEAISGVKVTLPSGGKAIVTGFGFDLIADPSARANIMAKSIEWLMKTEAAAPKISLSTESVDFGQVETEKTMNVQILNSGNADLVLSDVAISNDADGVFTVTDPTENTIAAGKSLAVEVKFTPIAGKASTGQLTITSNAGNKTVALAGQSSLMSVDNYLSNTGLFTMNVSPNPVSTQSVFTYELNTESAEYVSLQLVDLKGNVIAELHNGIQTPGTHTINLDATKYAYGQYFILANLLGHNARFNVVVAK
jgi:hypothetical protein